MTPSTASRMNTRRKHAAAARQPDLRLSGRPTDSVRCRAAGSSRLAVAMETSSPSCRLEDGTSRAVRSTARPFEWHTIAMASTFMSSGSTTSRSRAAGTMRLAPTTFWSTSTSPRAVLKGIRDALNPGGVLHLQLPNIRSLDGRLGRQSWWGLRCPQHVTFYEPRHLRQLLAEEGFRVALDRDLRPVAQPGSDGADASGRWRSARIAGHSARSRRRGNPRPCDASPVRCRHLGPTPPIAGPVGRWPDSWPRPRRRWASATSRT